MNFLTNYLHRLINYLQNDSKGIIVIEKKKNKNKRVAYLIKKKVHLEIFNLQYKDLSNINSLKFFFFVFYLLPLQVGILSLSLNSFSIHDIINIFTEAF